MKVTAVVNQKGGVGKTATSANVAGALAELGQRVLVVDLDPQGHLTKALQLPAATPPATFAAALAGTWDGDPAALAVMYGGADGRIAAIPNAPDMFAAARDLDRLRAREERLGRVLAPLGDMFDHCLIDCPPALDILTDNALTAADGVLIPVQAEDSSLHALRLLLAQINALEAELRRTPLVLHGLVISMLDRGRGGLARSNVGRSVVEEFARLGLPILATVPRGVPVTEAWRYGKTVGEYAPDSEHAQVYRALAKTLADA